MTSAHRADSRATTQRLPAFGRLDAGVSGAGVHRRGSAQRLHAGAAVTLGLSIALGCASGPPRNPDNLCDIFEERRNWYRASKRSTERWGVPIPVQMALIHQESRFRSDAKPPRRRILWIFPGPRPSSAYGYAQALETTWDAYRRETGNRRADRDDFDDAVDFIGWYGAAGAARGSAPRSDPYAFYLAYHEGHGGYLRSSYASKSWLLSVARKVERRASHYGAQLEGCRERLDRRRFRFWPF